MYEVTKQRVRMGEKELYTTQEIAKELNLSDAYIRQLIAAGKAHPTQQIGGTWMFTVEEIERLRTRSKSKGGRPKKGGSL